ncbi:MAG: hypothetical protein RIE87_17725 [Rhodospirillales bacterium]
MNQYKFIRRFKTLAELYEPFKFRNFTFRSWNYDALSGTCGDAWLVESVYEADRVEEANVAFSDELADAINRIAFVSQCFTWSEFEPFLIFKLNKNEQRKIFFRYAEDHGSVGLSFLGEEISALQALEAYQEKGDVFRYLKEAGNAPTFYTRMAMLMSALEAMAGQDINSKGWKVTKKNYIRDKILKNDKLFNHLYEPKTGFRNNLVHGGTVDWSGKGPVDFDYIREVYSAIVRYFRENHGVKIEGGVVDPLRNPLGNYRVWKGWLKPRSPEIEIDLVRMNAAFHYSVTGEGEKPEIDFDQAFQNIGERPEGY